jgi:hypothetical protein
VPIEIGRRNFFLPRACVLQSRHSGIVNAVAKRNEGSRLRLEGIWNSLHHASDQSSGRRGRGKIGNSMPLLKNRKFNEK